MTPSRDHYAAQAMTVLMVQHPNATRGWIAQMSHEMAAVMASGAARDVRPGQPFADAPRIYAEDEAAHAAQAAQLPVPDSIRFLGRYVPGFTP